jgi:hypothetical protein
MTSNRRRQNMRRRIPQLLDVRHCGALLQILRSSDMVEAGEINHEGHEGHEEFAVVARGGERRARTASRRA